ncbi:hypothetical protein PGC35_00940 [Psychrobacillus sp. PGGUH221]|uniref:hypothetical protein n=1 Tax=Psychrobacillus sp. PGGUH221 TaxID=3020058 RepID=UPI0035C70DEF
MQEDNIKKVLCALINMKIGLYLRNSKFVEGILLDVKQDHLAVDVNGKVFYFAFEHIGAISKNAKDYSVYPKTDSYPESNDLTDVLKVLKYNWVTINSLSNQALVGVLTSIVEDHIILINNQDLYYIPKSYISSIHKGISKMEINKINEQSTEISNELVIQDTVSSVNAELIQFTNVAMNENQQKDEHQEQILAERFKTYNNYEEFVKVPIMEEQTEEKNKAINEVPDVLSLHSVEDIPLTKEWSIKSNNDDQNEAKNLRNLISELHYSALGFNSTMKENNSELLKSVSHLVDNIESNNDVLEIKTNQVLSVPDDELLNMYNENENHVDISQEVEVQETMELIDKLKISLNQEETQNLPNREDLEADYLDPYNSRSSVINEEQIISKEPEIQNKEKRILLTAWSKMNLDQNSITIPPKKNVESESPTHKTSSVVVDLASDHEKSFVEEMHENNTTEEHGKLVIAPEHSEVFFTADPISPIEKKAMLLKQYYALMKHAENNSANQEYRSVRYPTLDYQVNNKPEFEELKNSYVSESLKEEKAVLENQFYSLMRHAAKMYRQIRDF